MKMPSAKLPVSKRHRTGARVVPLAAVALVVRRWPTDRLARAPMTAAA